MCVPHESGKCLCLNIMHYVMLVNSLQCNNNNNNVIIIIMYVNNNNVIIIIMYVMYYNNVIIIIVYVECFDVKPHL